MNFVVVMFVATTRPVLAKGGFKQRKGVVDRYVNPK
jgi:hypothetical protein